MKTPGGTTNRGPPAADGATEGTAGAGQDLRVLQGTGHRRPNPVVRARWRSAHTHLPQLPGQAGGLLARYG